LSQLDRDGQARGITAARRQDVTWPIGIELSPLLLEHPTIELNQT
jgi:hypothetical protein